MSVQTKTKATLASRIMDLPIAKQLLKEEQAASLARRSALCAEIQQAEQEREAQGPAFAKAEAEAQAAYRRATEAMRAAEQKAREAEAARRSAAYGWERRIERARAELVTMAPEECADFARWARQLAEDERLHFSMPQGGLTPGVHVRYKEQAEANAAELESRRQYLAQHMARRRLLEQRAKEAEEALPLQALTDDDIIVRLAQWRAELGGR